MAKTSTYAAALLNAPGSDPYGSELAEVAPADNHEQNALDIFCNHLKTKNVIETLALWSDVVRAATGEDIGTCSEVLTDNARKIAKTPDKSMSDKHIALKLSTYFARLFTTIETSGLHDLSKFDLWHGHFFRGCNGTICIVFHAKEYPSDIPEGGGPGRSGFSTRHPKWRYRNVLWSSATKKLYKIDAYGGVALNKVHDKSWTVDKTSSKTYSHIILPNIYTNLFFSAPYLLVAARSITLFPEYLGKPLGILEYVYDQSTEQLPYQRVLYRAEGGVMVDGDIHDEYLVQSF